MLVVGRGSGYNNGGKGAGSGAIVYLRNVPLSLLTKFSTVSFNTSTTIVSHTTLDTNLGAIYADDAPRINTNGADNYSWEGSIGNYVYNWGSNGGNNYGWPDPDSNTNGSYCYGGGGSNGNGKRYDVWQENGGDGCFGYSPEGGDSYKGNGYRGNSNIIPLSSIFEGTGLGGPAWTLSTTPIIYYGGGAGGYGTGMWSANRPGYGAGGGPTTNGYDGEGGAGIVVLYYHNDPL